jgi:peptidoglycan/LPS O-acetylase OafA/YrhL
MGAVMKFVLVGAVALAMAGQAMFWSTALAPSAADDGTPTTLVSTAIGALFVHLDEEISQFIVLR